MKERPILFNTEMVKAVLAGNKTQTRRVIKNACDIITDWDKNDPSYGPFYEDEFGDSHESIERCPYGKIGDQLWVREAWRACMVNGLHHPGKFMTIQFKSGFGVLDYRTDWEKHYSDLMEKTIWDDSGMNAFGKWKPSIFLPRKHSRIQLEITNIQVQRIQDISETDALAEGITEVSNKSSVESLIYGHTLYKNYSRPKSSFNQAKASFKSLWDSINKKRGFGWDENPWVWVVEFKVI